MSEPESLLAENGPDCPVVVVDGGFNGLNAKLVEKIGPQASQASNRGVGGVTVLHADKAGLAVAAETVGNSQQLARDTTVDPELATDRELEHCPTNTRRAEHVGELPGSKLGS